MGLEARAGSLKLANINHLILANLPKMTQKPPRRSVRFGEPLDVRFRAIADLLISEVKLRDGSSRNLCIGDLHDGSAAPARMALCQSRQPSVRRDLKEVAPAVRAANPVLAELLVSL